MIQVFCPWHLRVIVAQQPGGIGLIGGNKIKNIGPKIPSPEK